MAGTAFLIFAGVWLAQAIAAAVTARRLGQGSLEFFVYGLLMPPAAWLLLAFAGRRPVAAATGPVLSAGLWTARSSLAAAVLALATTVALAPDRMLSTLERTAQRGVEFDACAEAGSMQDCMPVRTVALIGDAVAGTLSPERVAPVTMPPLRTAPAPAFVRASGVAPDAADESATIEVVAVRRLPSGDADRAAPSERQAVADSDNSQETSLPVRPASAAQIRSAQILLASLGYDPGPADGIPGSRTARAVEAFERDTELAMTGNISSELLARLDREAAALPVRAAPLPGDARDIAAISDRMNDGAAAPPEDGRAVAARAPGGIGGAVERQPAAPSALAAPLRLSAR